MILAMESKYSREMKIKFPTPPKTNMEAENASLEKEQRLENHHSWW